MSKPIVLTEDILQEWLKEFEQKARSAKMTGGKFTYTQEIEYEGEDKVRIIFTPMAYAKMLALLREFNDEVAWHGIVDRHGEGEFVISDILVYPQEVTGQTVNTDQEEYTKWTCGIPDELFNRMHMQGHSHVRMSVSPSAVDLTHQEAIVGQLHGDHFYIFMIWNKNLEHNIKVYDFRENTLYEDKDCVVTVGMDGLDEAAFVNDAKAQVKRKTYQQPASMYGQSTRWWDREQNTWSSADRTPTSEVKSPVPAKTGDKKDKKKGKGDKKIEVKGSTKTGVIASSIKQSPATQQKLTLGESQPSKERILAKVTDFDKFVYGTT